MHPYGTIYATLRRILTLSLMLSNTACRRMGRYHNAKDHMSEPTGHALRLIRAKRINRSDPAISPLSEANDRMIGVAPASQVNQWLALSDTLPCYGCATQYPPDQIISIRIAMPEWILVCGRCAHTLARKLTVGAAIIQPRFSPVCHQAMMMSPDISPTGTTAAVHSGSRRKRDQSSFP